jgi:hypothetical protein
VRGEEEIDRHCLFIIIIIAISQIAKNIAHLFTIVHACHDREVLGSAYFIVVLIIHFLKLFYTSFSIFYPLFLPKIENPILVLAFIGRKTYARLFGFVSCDQRMPKCRF